MRYIGQTLEILEYERGRLVAEIDQVGAELRDLPPLDTNRYMQLVRKAARLKAELKVCEASIDLAGDF